MATTRVMLHSVPTETFMERPVVSKAYYNEFDPYAAAWLRNLIAEGLIAPGDVDERSIADVRPSDLADYDQCHFFAGIGGWSLALRLAGVPDNFPIWTGSCPCQPFSAAGKRAGFTDERHLWPHFHHLISVCKPAIVAGEQVASRDGLGWLDLVRADLEGEGYAVGAADLCAAGVGAPHIRQRLYWIGERLADPFDEQLDGGGYSRGRRGELADDDGTHWLADAYGRDTSAEREQRGGEHGFVEADGVYGLGGPRPGPTNGFWRAADWLLCRDGKWRPG